MNKEVWFFIFFLGMLFFNWPVLEIFRLSLPYYFFSAWAIFIAIIFLLINIRKKALSLRNMVKKKDV